jgi:hypothetical protein
LERLDPIAISRVVEQRHETEVHVQLLMAMEESKAGIVSYEIDFMLLIATQHHDILHNSRRFCAREIRELEAMAMKMDRMNVVASIAHPNAITVSLFQME